MLHRVSSLLSNLQSGTIEKVSFYKSTTNFVRYVQNSGNYSSVAITGHSLGGGLAIISGAQTGVQAIGISAPNALISRRRFDITPDDIERYTFNVIPDRDPVAAADDPAKTIQRIECRAPENKRFDCHFKLRSLCEIIYTCGSGSRPVPCECVKCFGYPEPLPNANTTISFEEACRDMQPCA
jgi:lipase ATG15